MKNRIYVDLDLAVQYSYSLEFFKKLAKMFLENQKNLLSEIEEFFYRDEEMYHLKIHTIKGISKNLGSDILYETSIKVLNDLKSKESFEEFKRVFQEVYGTLNEIVMDNK